MRPKVEVCPPGVCTLDKISKWYPQSEYSGLGMSLQLEWQYLQSTIPGVRNIIGSKEDSLRESLFLALFTG